MVVFRNYQWGAEKRNSTLWYDDNFVGTELDPNLSYAKVAQGCGLKGVTVRTQAELTAALKRWKLQSPPNPSGLLFASIDGKPKHRSTITHEYPVP